jgi:hypothetical protein
MDSKYMHSSLQPKPTWASQSHELALQLRQASLKQPPFEHSWKTNAKYTAIYT